MAYEGPHPLPVPSGGTGDASFTAYAVLTGGTTSTGALQNVSGVGTSGQVLTSNGASALPTWQAASGGSAFTSIHIQTFTSNGTYTPTANMKFCTVQLVGGGGGGGGSQVSDSTHIACAGGGGAGGYVMATFSAATIGSSQTVTIGSAGAGGAAGVNDGAAGNTTSFGSLISATGGGGGQGGLSGVGGAGTGGVGGTGTGGDVNTQGAGGGVSIGLYYAAGSSALLIGGFGGASFFGGGGIAQSTVTSVGSRAGSNAASFGAGGSGAVTTNDVAKAGGNGAAGFVYITEYI